MEYDIKKGSIAARQFFTALILLFSSSLLYAAPDINIGTVNGLPGNTVNLPITITNDGSAAALQLDIQYDASQFTIGAPVAGNALSGHGVASSSPTVGVLRIVIVPTTDNSLIGSGTLVSIPFTIGATVSTSQPVTITNLVLSDATATSVTSTSTGGLTGEITITDILPPVVTAPINITVEANNTLTPVNPGVATALDNVDGVLTPTPDTTGPFGLGSNTIVWSATDAAGNTGTAIQLVTIQDTTQPVITPPTDLTRATSNSTPIAVDIGQATATDIFTPVAVTNDAPALFPLGTTTVTWTATDANNNSATATQLVTVAINNSPPVIIPPASISTEATAVLTPVTLGVATATDGEDGILVPIASTTGPFSLGVNTVVWSVTDSGGLTTAVNQSVTITDTTPPVLTAPAAVSATTMGTTPVAVNLGQATATDIFAVIINNDAPATFPVGTTTVTWTATDANSNAVTATQLVTVNSVVGYEYSILNPALSTGSTQVVSLSNNNTIQVGTTVLNLNQYQRGTIPGSDMQRGASISGSGPFDIGSSINATDMPVPVQFEGTQFVIPHYRNSHTYYLLSTSGNATVQIQIGTSTTPVALPPGQVVEFNAGSNNGLSGIINSDLPIRIMHRAGAFIDAYPVPPAALEVWGVRTNNVFIGALQDGTNITITSHTGSSTSIVLNAGGRYAVTTGSSGSQGSGHGFRITADQPIAAVQGADSDGSEQSTFMRTQDLGTRFGIPTNAQYIAIVCPTLNTSVTLYNSQGVVQSQQSCTGTVHGKAYFGSTTSGANIAGGSYLISDQPIFVMYEDSATNDEHNLLGYKPSASGNTVPVAQNDSINTAINTAVIINVLSNDTDSDGDSLTVTDVTQGANGGVVINTDNTVSYTPNANYIGSDSFSYSIADGNGGSANANVTITIAAASNNIPQVTNPGAINLIEGDSINLAIIATDADNDTLTYSATGLPSGASIDTNTGLISGTQAIGSAGSYTVTVSVNDGLDTASTSFTWTVTSSAGTLYEYSILNPALSTGSAQVVSLSDNNTIQVGTTVLNLNQYQRGTIPASDMQRGASISGSGPFDIGSSIDATDMPVPVQFEGTRFVIPHYRNSHTYYLLSTSGNATVQVQIGTSTTPVALPQGQVVEFNAGSNNGLSGIINSDLPIRVMHRANSGSFIDAYPVPPAALEVWGVRTNNAFIGALQDGTNITITSHTGSSTSIVLNAGGRYAVTTGSSGSQGSGHGFRITADQPIAAAQGADSDGSEQSTFMRTQDLGTRFGIPTNAQYIAIVCPTLNTNITLYDNQGVVQSQQSCTGTVHGKAYFGSTTSGANIAAGSYLESDQPIYVMYEDSAQNEEHNLLGVAGQN